MKTKNSPKYTYLEWFSPEELHEAGLAWFSELNFARDEQAFLNDLVKSYTLQLTEHSRFEKSKNIETALSKVEKEGVALMKQVQAHENQLEIMLDGVDQLAMEKAYLQTHKELLIAVGDYMKSYRKVKETLMELVSQVMKQEKQKRLLN
ncbi:MAG: hypothetical protein E4H26_05515 [Flavobacteriales bacterium]|nr:MAG: hypothetical protein E4H26_05515 [Flavobacteriales bacterium]